MVFENKDNLKIGVKMMMNKKSEEVNLNEYLEVIIKRKVTLLSFFIFFLAVGIIYAYFTPKVYEAESIISVGIISKPIITEEDAGEVARRDYFLNDLVKELDNRVSGEELMDMLESRMIVFKGILESRFIKIFVRHTDRQKAMDICNAVAESFVKEGNKFYSHDFSWTEDYVRTAQANRKQNETVVLFQRQLRQASDFKLFAKPKVSSFPVHYRNNNFNIAMFSLLGLVLGIFFVFLQEYYSRKES